MVTLMRDLNYFSARFALKRVLKESNFVIARCRVTVPNIGSFPLDSCPDTIPTYGQDYMANEDLPIN